MSKETKKTLDELGRQPDVEPPTYALTAPPSLWLYASLLIFALALIVAAFRFGPADWAGFFINLATEIIGAVIILILVERRFRSTEISFIQSLPKRTRLVLFGWLGERKELKSYARILLVQTDRASLPFYVSRPEIEEVLLAKRSKGFALVGMAGIGKTTLLHFLVSAQAKDVLAQPKKAKIPILVSAIRWREQEAVDVLRTTMQSFYPISDHIFNRLLRKGRLMCIVDGLDELIRPQEMIDKLRRFQSEYSGNTLIVSSRDLSYEAFDNLNLEKVAVSSLTTEEALRLLMLRRRMSKSESLDKETV